MGRAGLIACVCASLIASSVAFVPAATRHVAPARLATLASPRVVAMSAETPSFASSPFAKAAAPAALWLASATPAAAVETISDAQVFTILVAALVCGILAIRLGITLYATEQ